MSNVNKDDNIYSVLKNNKVIDENLIISTIIEYSQDTFYFKDIESRFLFISKAVALRLGFENPMELIGKTDFDLFDLRHAEEAYFDEQNIIKTGIPIINKIEKEIWKNGNIVWISSSKYPLKDREGKIIGTWGLSRDITAQKQVEEKLELLNLQMSEANKKLEMLSKLDSISNLYNNRNFYEEIQNYFKLYQRQNERGHKSNFTVALLDIDNFKSINDTVGHLAGDCTIKHFAEVLKSAIRSTDKAFRYGGDEFVILLPDTDIFEAVVVAEKVRKRIYESPFMLNGNKISVTVSGGVASFEEAESINDLLEKADQRMYKSKSKGKNKISI